MLHTTFFHETFTDMVNVHMDCGGKTQDKIASPQVFHSFLVEGQ